MQRPVGSHHVEAEERLRWLRRQPRQSSDRATERSRLTFDGRTPRGTGTVRTDALVSGPMTESIYTPEEGDA